MLAKNSQKLLLLRFNPLLSESQSLIYPHNKALSTAGVRTTKGPLALVLSQYVTLQVEAAAELFIAPFSGAQQLSLYPTVDTQLMQAQEPGVVKQLFALSTRHLGYKQTEENQ